jgi:hypothetical protein
MQILSQLLQQLVLKKAIILKLEGTMSALILKNSLKVKKIMLDFAKMGETTIMLCINIESPLLLMMLLLF